MTGRGRPADTGTERLSHLLAELAAAVDADRGASLFVDQGDGVLHRVASSAAPQRGRSLPRLVGRREGHSGETDLIAVPDVRGGVLMLERARHEPFSADDRAVARLYARQLADQVVVGGVDVRGSIWTRQLEAIQSIAAQLTRLTSVDGVAATLCVETRRVIAFDNIRVHLVSPDGRTLEPVAFRSHHPAYAGETADGLRLRVGEGRTGSVASSGRAQLVPDAGRDARTPELAAESMLLVPLRHENRVMGVITLSRLGSGAFTEDDLRLLQVLSDQVAVAIENARLLASRERLVDELQALLEIGQAGTLAHDELTLAGLLAAKLRRASKMDGCVIARWDEASTRLHALGRDDGVVVGLEALDELDAVQYPTIRRVLLDGSRQLLGQGDTEMGPTEAALLAGLGASALLLLPLSTAGRVIGVVELCSTTAGRALTLQELDLYATMANHAAAVLENARLLVQLRQAADIDQVTGLNNHRYLQERLRQEVARAARTRVGLCVLMIDLDGFKRINDSHGHADGDRVLKDVAAMLKLTVRTNDVVARYGGDEFVILMPDTEVDAARIVAERVVRGIQSQPHQLSDGGEAYVSCSVGLSVHPTDGRTAAQLLKSADAAMYGVKRAGGSQVGRIRARSRTAAPPVDAVSAG